MEHRGTIELETERLLLRRFRLEDAEAMYANWASDPEVVKYLTWPVHPSADVTRQLLEHWVARYDSLDVYHWGLELKSAGELIGDISVVRLNEDIAEAELGWCMGRAWWGQGLMPEAGRAVLGYLFEQAGFNRLCARHDVDNPKSGRVMQKLGMRCEGTRRQGGRNNRGIIDDVCYAILKSDWTEAQLQAKEP